MLDAVADVNVDTDFRATAFDSFAATYAKA